MALTILHCLRSRWSNFKYFVQTKPPIVLFIIGLICFSIVLATLARIVDRSNIETAANENWNVFLNHFSKLEFCVSSGNASNSISGEAATALTPASKDLQSQSFRVPVTVHLSSFDQLMQYSNLTVLAGSVSGKVIGLKGDLAQQTVDIVMHFGGTLSEFVEPCSGQNPLKTQGVMNSSNDASTTSPVKTGGEASQDLSSKRGGLLGGALRDFWCSTSFEVRSACVEFLASGKVLPNQNKADRPDMNTAVTEEGNRSSGGGQTKQSDGTKSSSDDEPEVCDAKRFPAAGQKMVIEARRASPYSSLRNRNCDGRARLTMSHKIDPSLLTALTLKDKTIIYLHLSATIYFLLCCIFCTFVYACCHSKRDVCHVTPSESPHAAHELVRPRLRPRRDAFASSASGTRNAASAGMAREADKQWPKK